MFFTLADRTEPRKDREISPNWVLHFEPWSFILMFMSGIIWALVGSLLGGDFYENFAVIILVILLPEALIAGLAAYENGAEWRTLEGTRYSSAIEEYAKGSSVRAFVHDSFNFLLFQNGALAALAYPFVAALSSGLILSLWSFALQDSIRETFA